MPTDVTVELGSAAGKPGDVVTLPLTLSVPEGARIIAVQGNIIFDDGLLSCDRTAIMFGDNWGGAANVLNDNKALLSIFNPFPPDAGVVIVARVPFTISHDAAPQGTHVDLSLDIMPIAGPGPILDMSQWRWVGVDGVITITE